MRVVRLTIAVLISLGLSLAPVAAGVAEAHMVKCEQMMGAQHDDCDCCGDPATCPPSSCVTQCFTIQVGLAEGAVLTPLLRERLRIDPSASVRSLTLSPDPPPPRS